MEHTIHMGQGNIPVFIIQIANLSRRCCGVHYVRHLNFHQGFSVENLESQQDIATRVLRLMPESESVLALVITGHLLIEERLTALLTTLALDPKSLEKARLTFKQRVLLVRAFALQSTPTHIWQFIEGTNSLRNQLAHNVEPPEIAEKVSILVKLVPDAHTRLPDPLGNTKSRFTLAVSVCCGHLFGLRFVHAQHRI